jgi:hypothetical protein
MPALCVARAGRYGTTRILTRVPPRPLSLVPRRQLHLNDNKLEALHVDLFKSLTNLA